MGAPVRATAQVPAERAAARPAGSGPGAAWVASAGDPGELVRSSFPSTREARRTTRSPIRRSGSSAAERRPGSASPGGRRAAISLWPKRWDPVSRGRRICFRGPQAVPHRGSRARDAVTHEPPSEIVNGPAIAALPPSRQPVVASALSRQARCSRKVGVGQPVRINSRTRRGGRVEEAGAPILVHDRVVFSGRRSERYARTAAFGATRPSPCRRAYAEGTACARAHT